MDEKPARADTIPCLEALVEYIINQKSRDAQMNLGKVDEHLAGLQELWKRITGKPGYFRCGYCDFCYYEVRGGSPHDCYSYPNRLDDEDLDSIHADTGWDVIAVIERTAPVKRSRPDIRSQPDPRPQPDRPEPIEPEPVEPSSAAMETSMHTEAVHPQRAFPRVDGLRPGSKRHRVYIEIRELLKVQHSMHVDDILERIESLDVFNDIKNVRSNLFNILSQFKTKGLLVSDNRGNWTLR